MNYWLLCSGFALLLLVLTDFLYTTLSCNGSGYLTHYFNRFMAKLWMPHASNGFKKWVGLIHLVFTILNWIVLIIVAAFLINTSSPDMVISTSSEIPAGTTERLYYSTYVYSTLGNGDLKPGNNFSRIFTAMFSIIGFGMLTIGITYLLSITNAALVKKQLASIICGMGNNPFDLYQYFNNDENAGVLLQRSDALTDLIQKHTNNHLSYPIVHYFMTDEHSKSVAIHTTSLNETLVVLKKEHSDNESIISEIKRLQWHLRNFLKVSSLRQGSSDLDHIELNNLRDGWKKYSPTYQIEDLTDVELQDLFTVLLKSQGWSWYHVYNSNEND